MHIKIAVINHPYSYYITIEVQALLYLCSSTCNLNLKCTLVLLSKSRGHSILCVCRKWAVIDSWTAEPKRITVASVTVTAPRANWCEDRPCLTWHQNSVSIWPQHWEWSLCLYYSCVFIYRLSMSVLHVVKANPLYLAPSHIPWFLFKYYRQQV